MIDLNLVKTQRLSISMFLSLYIQISGFGTVGPLLCHSLPLSKVMTESFNITNQSAETWYACIQIFCFFFFFTLNSCPAFSNMLSLLLPIFNFLSQFHVYFLAQRAKQYSMVLTNCLVILSFQNCFLNFTYSVGFY